MNLRLNTKITKGIIFLIISIVLYCIVPSQIKLVEGEGAINGRSFPYLLITIMGVSSFLQIIIGLLSKNKQYWIVDATMLRRWKVPMLMLLLVSVYVAIIPYIGFVIASILAVCGTLAFLRCKKWHYYAISVGFVVTIYLIFTSMLNVPLPTL